MIQFGGEATLLKCQAHGDLSTRHWIILLKQTIFAAVHCVIPTGFVFFIDCSLPTLRPYGTGLTLVSRRTMRP